MISDSLGSYSSVGISSVACNCTGRCRELGYCPNAETAQQAIARLERQIEQIKQSEKDRLK